MTTAKLGLIVSFCALAAEGCALSRSHCPCEPSCGAVGPACAALNDSHCPATRPGRPYAHFWRGYRGAEIEHDIYGTQFSEAPSSGQWTPLFGGQPAETVRTPPAPVVEWDEAVVPTPTPSPRRAVSAKPTIAATTSIETTLETVDVAPALIPARQKLVETTPATPDTAHSLTPTVKTKKLKTSPAIELAPLSLDRST